MFKLWQLLKIKLTEGKNRVEWKKVWSLVSPKKGRELDWTYTVWVIQKKTYSQFHVMNSKDIETIGLSQKSRWLKCHVFVLSFFI